MLQKKIFKVFFFPLATGTAFGMSMWTPLAAREISEMYFISVGGL
jgi:hypothetical protein